MDTNVFINGMHIDATEYHPKDDGEITEVLIKGWLHKGKGFFVMTKKFMIGSAEFVFGTLLVDDFNWIRISDNELQIKGLYPYEEYRGLEFQEGVQVKTINGRKLIECWATVDKKDIFLFTIFNKKDAKS